MTRRRMEEFPKKISSKLYLTRNVIDKDLDIEVKKYQRNVDNLKKYGKRKDGLVDYHKLWALINENIEEKEKEVRFKVEKEHAEKEVKAEKEAKKEEKKKEKGRSKSKDKKIEDIEPLSSYESVSVRNKIIRGYSEAGTPKEVILDRIIPSGSYEANIDKLSRKINSDIKEVETSTVKAFLAPCADGKTVQKIKLKEVLFAEELTLQSSDKITWNDQIRMVFKNLDFENKNQLTKDQVRRGCMQLGINKSPTEMDALFDEFKDPGSQTVSQQGFFQLLEHKYCQDIMKERAVRERFNEVMEKVDPFNTFRLTPGQLKNFYHQVYPESTQAVSDEELNAVLAHCGVTDGSISSETLKRKIVSGKTKFEPGEEKLADGLMKLRTGLYCSVSEQYRNFMFMPNNFIQSFTEASYQKGLTHLPTSTMRPSLGEGRLFYSNLFPPAAGQENISYSKFNKYIKLSKHSQLFEISLEKATGVPIPDDVMVSYSEIVGREIRISLFEETTNKLQANILNLECRWSSNYEDRYYFDVNKVSNETKMLVKIPDAEMMNQTKKHYVLFELVNFVKKEHSSAATAMSAGYALLPLFNQTKFGGKVLDIHGGSPYKDHTVQILPEEVRHKRRGFIPKIVSIFEGKIKSKLNINLKKINTKARSYDGAEEIELLPDEGIYHWPQLKIYSCFRQCLGKDAFAFLGSVTASANMHLGTEAYVNSFCNLMNIPSVATIMGDFWNSNVVRVFAKESYELKMDCLKAIFNFLYPLLNSVNFEFNRSNPTDNKHGQNELIKERLALLKNNLTVVWASVQTRRESTKIVNPKFMPAVQKLESSAAETRHTAFSIDELLDEDIDQI